MRRWQASPGAMARTAQRCVLHRRKEYPPTRHAARAGRAGKSGAIPGGHTKHAMAGNLDPHMHTIPPSARRRLSSPSSPAPTPTSTPSCHPPSASSPPQTPRAPTAPTNRRPTAAAQPPQPRHPAAAAAAHHRARPARADERLLAPPRPAHRRRAAARWRAQPRRRPHAGAGRARRRPVGSVPQRRRRRPRSRQATACRSRPALFVLDLHLFGHLCRAVQPSLFACHAALRFAFEGGCAPRFRVAQSCASPTLPLLAGCQRRCFASGAGLNVAGGSIECAWNGSSRAPSAALPVNQ